MRKKLEWTKDVGYAMNPLRFLTWPVGTWPLQDYNVFSVVRSTVCAVLVFGMVLTVASEIGFNENDADKNIDSLVLCSCGTLAFTKITWFRIHASHLVYNFKSAMEDYSSIASEEKRLIVRRHAYMGRVAFGSLFFFSYFSVISLILGPLVVNNAAHATNHSLEYPVPATSTFQYLNVPDSLYTIIFIAHILMLMAVVHGNLGNDCMFFGITFHVCGQVELLKNEFQQFVGTTERTLERFGALVSRHQELLLRAEKLARIISFILIIQLSLSCVLTCIIGFQCILALKYKDVAMLGKTLTVVGALMSQLFAYSYVGDYLKCQMEDLGHCAYCSGWYDFPGRIANNVAFILMRAQQPVQLTAGSYFVVNMESYMSILKTSLSYLSVLRVMIDDE